MKVIEKQDFKTKYTLKFYNKVQKLVEQRKELHISQTEIARVGEVSLRKVQMFENYNSLDYYMIWLYKQILKQ